jgi:hypothetical protein
MQACPRLLGSGLACGCEEVVLYRAGTGMRGRARWCENQSLGCGELKSMCRGVCEGRAGLAVEWHTGWIGNGAAAYALQTRFVIVWLRYCVITGL